MKHLWKICGLSLVMCLMLGTALAVDATILPAWEAGQPVRTVQEMLSVGDTAYFQMRTDDGGEIWYWREDMAQAEPLAKGLTFASSFTDIAQAYETLDEARRTGEAALPDVEHAITCIFTDGETLYAFNNLNGRVFTLAFEEGKAVFKDVVTLQDTAVMHDVTNGIRYYNNPFTVCAVGDTILWLDWKWREGAHGYSAQDEVYTLTCFSLKDGTSRTATLSDPRYVMPYKDDKALVLIPEWAEDEQRSKVKQYVIYTYDPADDTTQMQGTWNTSFAQRLIEYDRNTDTLYYRHNGNIFGMTNFGQTEVYAASPDNAGGDLTIVGSSVLLGKNSVVARTLTAGFVPERDVTYLGELPSGVQDRFIAAYPSVPLKQSSDGSPDVLHGEVPDAMYDKMVEEGQLMDLSQNSVIRAYVESLYPPFRELVEKDGKILAVPVEVRSDTGFFINRKVQQELGIATQDVPTNLVDLCAFVSKWSKNDAVKHPYYTVLEGVYSTYRERIYNRMFYGWLDYCQANGVELHFDDPIFREMLTALDNMDATTLEAQLKRPLPEMSDYMQGLIWDNCKLIGNFSSYMEEFSDRTFLPMTLTKDTPYSAKIQSVSLWGISADTENPEGAMALLEEIIAGMDVKQKAVLQSTWTDEVRNPDYEDTIMRVQRNIRTLMDISVPNGDMSYRGIDAARLEAKKFLNGTVKRQEYRITASALANYQQVIAPVMYVEKMNVLQTNAFIYNAFFALRDLYIDRMIDGETFITTADQFLTVTEAMQNGTPEEQRLYEMCKAFGQINSSEELPALVETWFPEKKWVLHGK